MPVTTAITPPALTDNDLTAIVAPAGPMDAEDLKRGIDLLKKTFRVLEDPRLTERYGFFAGEDATRLSVTQRAIDHPEVKAVLAARGGYGTTRILDSLRLDNLLRNPRWIVGSSDITALLFHLWERYRLVTIHGPMVARFVHGTDDDTTALFGLLKGGEWTPPEGLVGCIPGSAAGPFIGGNLCMLAHLVGSVSPDVFENAILFIEDVAEAPYRVDRMMTQLRRARFLCRLGGVVLGAFTRCEPGADGVTVREVLFEHLRRLDIPVAENYPAAHGGRNYPFFHGAVVSLLVKEDRSVRMSVLQTYNRRRLRAGRKRREGT